MNNKFIPFDLEKAKSGEPLICRCGIEPTEFHFFETSNPHPFRCRIVINGFIHNIRENGKFLVDDEHEYDLFMKPVLKEQWTNVYSDYKPAMGGVYSSKEEADRCAAAKRTHYLKTYWDQNNIIQPELTEWIPIDNKANQQ